MEKSKLEKMGIQVSKLGFGCMRLPTNDGIIDREASLAMIDYAYNHGVNYFDTAWGYLGGKSEPFMGEALKRYPRDSFYLATKLPVWLVKNNEDFERIFEEQLQRLQTDHFDFYLLHSLSKARFEDVVRLGLYDLCKKKQAEGKIRWIGFSYHDQTDRFEALVDRYPWDFVQIQHNYIDPHIMESDKLYQILADRGIPAVVMEPVRGGFLATLPEEIAAPLQGFDPARSLASWALRWVAEQENIKITLSGMSSMEQVVDNIATFSAPVALSDDEHRAIDQVVEKILSVKTVPCTGCEYCMPCPFGVAIPDVFAVYNNYKLFRNAFRAGEEYLVQMDEAHRGDQCQRCGQCLPACPQHIEIPDRLAEAHRELAALAK